MSELDLQYCIYMFHSHVDNPLTDVRNGSIDFSSFDPHDLSDSGTRWGVTVVWATTQCEEFPRDERDDN